MKSYNQLFEKRFYESKIIDETFSKIFNEKGVDSSIDYLKSIGATKLDIDNYQIRDRISNWTQDNFNEEEKQKSMCNEIFSIYA